MSVTNVISTKQTVVGSIVSAGGLGSQGIITSIDISNFAIMGVTLGGWMFILGFLSVLAVVILNGIKIGGLIHKLFKHKEEEKVCQKDSVQ